MAEMIILNSSTDSILKRYSTGINEYTLPIKTPNVVEMGASAYVIASENNQELRRIKFGFTPHWAQKPMNLLTARAEGDKNQENDPYYTGPNSIFLKPAFKKAIQHFRCLVIADGFTCNVSGKEIQIYTNEKPSVFAGIYDYWKDPETEIVVPGFALITIPAIGMLRELGIKRMPVVLSYFNYACWIKPEKPLSYYLPMLDRSRDEIVNSFSVGTCMEPKPIEKKSSEPFPRRYRSKRETRPHSNEPWWGERNRMNKEENL